METGLGWQGALVRFQNALLLLKELGLSNSVGFKALTSSREERGRDRDFIIIAHVRNDSTFSKYFKNASRADMALFRGMFLKLSVRGHLGTGNSNAGGATITDCAIHQAFLPKFENEGQDAAITASIQREADVQYMMASVKHSGSLATMSYDLLGAKNSQGNIYTAVSTLLLHAHFERVAQQMSLDASTLMKTLLEDMKEQRLSVSFEVCSRCLSHHGQLPNGEYLVATAITRLFPDGHVEVLPLLEHLSFCRDHYLPVNDTWLFSSTTVATAAAEALDDIAHLALPTDAALRAMDAVVAQHPDRCVRIHGTYPHAEWQGSRIEGFVVAQSSQVSHERRTNLLELAHDLRKTTLRVSGEDAQTNNTGKQGLAGAKSSLSQQTSDRMDRFAEKTLESVGIQRGSDRAGGIEADLYKKLKDSIASVAPNAAPLLGDWKPAGQKEQEALMNLVRSSEVPLDGFLLLGNENVPPLPSRKALESIPVADLDSLAGGREELKDICDAAKSARSSSKSSRTPNRPLNAALVSYMQPLLASRGLRYKKKMWSYRLEGDDVPRVLASHSDGNGAQGQAPAHVAYCMMTFIIRNGIRSLKESKKAYRNYVQALVRRWGLPDQQAARVLGFANAWCEWVYKEGRVKQLRDELYLDMAEPFVSQFLAGGGADATCGALSRGVSGGLQGCMGFSGVALLVGFEADAVEEVARRVHAGGSGVPPKRWSEEHQESGWVVGLLPMDNRVAVKDKAWWTAVAPVLKIVHRPLPSLHNSSATQKEKKRLLGADRAALETPQKALEAYCAAAGVDVQQRILHTADWPQFVSPQVLKGGAAAGSSKIPKLVDSLGQERAEALINEVTEWLGGGVGPPPADPAVVVTFAATPGLGKTAICTELAKRLTAKGHHVVHHHSDALSPVARKGYWQNAGHFSETHRGDGCTTVVLADKNLINNPPGNWDTIGDTLAGYNAQTLAVFLTDAASATAVAAEPSAGMQAASPFSMEQFALAMLRVYGRNDHVGKLDARLPAVVRIVCAFGGTYRDTSPHEVHATLSRLFSKVLFLPVTRAVSSAPPPPPEKHARLMGMVREGFELGRFSDGKREALPEAFETELRTLLEDQSVQEWLNGLACDFESEVSALEAAVEERIAAAVAASGAAGAGRAAQPVGESVSRASDEGSAAAACAAAAQAALALGASGQLPGAASSSSAGPSLASKPRAPPKAVAAAAKSQKSNANVAGSAPVDGAAATAAAQAAAAMAGVSTAPTNLAPKPRRSGKTRSAKTTQGSSSGGAGSSTGTAGGSSSDAALLAAEQATSALASMTVSAPGATAKTPSAAKAPTAPDIDRKLAGCVYACVGKFDRSAVTAAFQAAQEASGIPSGAAQKAKPELHVTLWHKSEGTRQRGRACVAAEGSVVNFEVVGFDVSDRISAARVQLPAAQDVQLDESVLQVASPHVTLWFQRGVAPKEAGKLKQMHAEGCGGVRFLPLEEPLPLTGRVCLR